MSIKLIKFTDKYIGNLLCVALGSISKSKKPDKLENILIIQLWGIGETILALPAIRALSNKYKKAESASKCNKSPSLTLGFTISPIKKRNVPVSFIHIRMQVVFDKDGKNGIEVAKGEGRDAVRKNGEKMLIPEAEERWKIWNAG